MEKIRLTQDNYPPVSFRGYKVKSETFEGGNEICTAAHYRCLKPERGWCIHFTSTGPDWVKRLLLWFKTDEQYQLALAGMEHHLRLVGIEPEDAPPVDRATVH